MAHCKVGGRDYYHSATGDLELLIQPAVHIQHQVVKLCNVVGKWTTQLL